jgi:hypothetical protein
LGIWKKRTLPGAVRQRLNFGHHSKLDRIVTYGRDPPGARCFLTFSTKTLKVFRSRFDF